MRLVTQTETLARNYSDVETVEILAKAGFEAIDWSFFDMLNDDNIWNSDGWKEHALELKAAAEACGIGFSQAHAPFSTTFGDDYENSTLWPRIIRSMEIAALLGVKNIIVHPIHHIPYKKNREFLFAENVAMYKKLVPYCEKFGIRVCSENMWHYDPNRAIPIDSICSQPEEFCALLDAIDSEWIVGCLDIGHSAIVGVDPAEFIRALGPKRLQCLHVHDVDYKHDCHNMPYMEKLDWESIAAALAEIGYTGDFTLEADNYLKRFPKDVMPEASRLMAAVSRYIVSKATAK